MPCPVCKGDPQQVVYKNDTFPMKRNVLRCENCKIYLLSPMPSINELNEYYREHYSRIDYKSYLKFPMAYMKLFYANMRAVSQYRFIKSQIQILSGARVVDFGCATGNLLHLFKKDECKTLGVELGKRSSNWASSKYGLHILQTSIEDSFDKIDGGVDLIIFSHALEHTPDPINVLCKCFNLLRDGGHLFLELPNSYIGPTNGPQWEEFSTILLDSDHTYNFSSMNIECLLSHCNFITEKKMIFLSQRVASFLKRFRFNGKVDHILKKREGRVKSYISICLNTVYLAYLFSKREETVEIINNWKSWSGTNEWVRVLAGKG